MLTLDEPNGPPIFQTLASKPWSDINAHLMKGAKRETFVDPQNSDAVMEQQRILLYRPERATLQEWRSSLADDLNKLKWPERTDGTGPGDYASCRQSLPHTGRGVKMLRMAKYLGDVGPGKCSRLKTSHYPSEWHVHH